MDLTFRNPITARTARLIHALSADLRKIEAGHGPSVEDLTGAPVLSDWRIGFCFEPALVGTAQGHPRLADGPITTSGLFILDRQAGYARTLSRFYRLGPPAG